MLRAIHIAERVFPANNTKIDFYKVEGKDGYYFSLSQLNDALEYRSKSGVSAMVYRSGPVVLPTLKAKQLEKRGTLRLMPLDAASKVCRRTRRRLTGARFEAWFKGQVENLDRREQIAIASKSNKIASIMDASKLVMDFTEAQREKYQFELEEVLDQLLQVTTVLKSRVA